MALAGFKEEALHYFIETLNQTEKSDVVNLQPTNFEFGRRNAIM